jgi:hypothetical protein
MAAVYIWITRAIVNQPTLVRFLTPSAKVRTAESYALSGGLSMMVTMAWAVLE